jgi:hypothetical protein
MKYLKPEITSVDSAAVVIQGEPVGSKKGASPDNVRDITGAAYQADE